MNYLLDTCVLSEFTRRKPENKVIKWMDSEDEERLFISAITVGEIQRGIARLPESPRKNQLLMWMNNGLLQRFGSRILPLDASTLFLWGSLTARLESAGQPMALMDSLIVAAALEHNLIIATRNISDFANSGAQVFNPWE